LEEDGVMSVLDPERVRIALGQRLGDRFLKYARAPAGDEVPALLKRVDAYMAEVGEMASSRGGSRIDLRLAEAIATSCKRLLSRIDRSPPDGQAAIVGAVRYFLDTADVDRDDGARGFADDAEVVNHVQAFVAPDLPRLPV
jgi:hypothetical protein